MKQTLPKTDKEEKTEHLAIKNAGCSPLLDDCYVFDMAMGMKIIISRQAKGKKIDAESLYDIMSNEAVEELSEYMRTYTDVPIFVNTIHGKALVIPSLAPSCALGVMIFATFKTDNLYRIAVRYGYKVKASHELTDGKRCRLNNRCMKFEEQSIALLDMLERSFSGTAVGQLVTGDITDMLIKRIQDLAYYNAYPARVICENPVFALSDFDFSNFTAFVLVCILIARNSAKKSEITFTLESCESDICVLAAIPKGRMLQKDERALEKFKYIAAQNNMLFDCCKADRTLYVRFCPHPLDWALLGFKSQDIDEEEE